ncbi:LIM domain-containing protein [Streptomyces sp. H27-H5]|uniref:LIM domain-containing protein n=1 Tax=Streptomyces sp. H27-H5 TaxID=2996460 RepID=UPI003B63A4B8
MESQLIHGTAERACRYCHATAEECSMTAGGGMFWHKDCFRCWSCGINIDLGNFYNSLARPMCRECSQRDVMGLFSNGIEAGRGADSVSGCTVPPFTDSPSARLASRSRR